MIAIFTSGGPGASPPRGLGPAGLGPAFDGTEPAAPSAPAQPNALMQLVVPSVPHTRAALVSRSALPTLPAASHESWNGTKRVFFNLTCSQMLL